MDLRVAVWHPLDSEAGPGESVRVKRVVVEGCVLLPDLVLLEDPLFFQLVGVVH